MFVFLHFIISNHVNNSIKREKSKEVFNAEGPGPGARARGEGRAPQQAAAVPRLALRSYMEVNGAWVQGRRGGALSDLGSCLEQPLEPNSVVGGRGGPRRGRV